ncbi:protein-export membrane protein SecD [Candidatus Daviesbacteria bacterium RIFCSPLOWO2_01_FULL_40_24]|uniref:Protein translocase subunit SecD n=1 Tax=Candidatus Daviesbacteria bacterium RIFCSPLOWO2_01_FULL_40_24 TaxID=1797787 RepID=A0A1F5MIK5_9BACT|nr:MAG: protein-export membrane protein SecD [Candidatus Daviesbacteria bacterium RIFCSPLOWO2_01_FULL_40_24]
MLRKRLSFWFIILLTLGGIFVNLPDLPQDKWGVTGRFPLKLGLDLQGGTQLILQTQMENIPESDRDQALESARSVIERRVNLFGVSESIVQSSKVGSQRRILVELPGVKDLATAVNLVGQTAQLEFREMIDSPPPEATKSANPFREITKSTSLTGADLKKATVVFGSSNKGSSGPQVQIEFTSQGGEKFAEVTKRNIGKGLAIFVDESPVMWPPPTVQTEILGGVGVISGGFTTEEAKNLSIQLNAGALPVPIKILEQRSIAATLGAESVNKSLIAASVGLVTIMAYMVAFYGVYGLLADLGLLIYTIFVMAIFRSGLFLIPPVTLTLAGIAGFVLSIGMAVDANILTFERMREELRSGKNKKLALEAGFVRAWSSIRDSNISSLITATILYMFGTSLVKGFALTLAIGVLVSMFSALVVTRTFLRLLPRFR